MPLLGEVNDNGVKCLSELAPGDVGWSGKTRRPGGGLPANCGAGYLAGQG